MIGGIKGRGDQEKDDQVNRVKRNSVTQRTVFSSKDGTWNLLYDFLAKTKENIDSFFRKHNFKIIGIVFHLLTIRGPNL